MAKKVDYGEFFSRFASAPRKDRPLLPTGIFSIDYSLYGGLLEGVSHLIAGKMHSGKTQLCLSIVKQHQLKYPEKTQIYVDTEDSVQGEDIEKAGVKVATSEDPRGLHFYRLSQTEVVFEMFQAAALEANFGLAVLDTLEFLTNGDEMESEFAKAERVGKQKMTTRFINHINLIKLERMNAGNPITFLSTAHLKDKIGGFAPNGITPQYISGGYSQQANATTIIKLRRKEKRHDDTKGNTTDTLIGYHFDEKCRQAATSMSGEYYIGAGGVNEANTLYRVLNTQGVITVRGKDKRIEGIEKAYDSAEAIKQDIENDPAIQAYCRKMAITLKRVEDGKPEAPEDGYIA